LNSSLDEYRLEMLARDHSTSASMFVPFVVERLRDGAETTAAELRVSLRDVGQSGERERTLRLLWRPEDIPVLPLGAQQHTITEWAACGVAFAVLLMYTGLRVRGVATEGDRFDYWIDDGETMFGMEASGTMLEDLEGRHRAKVRQLRENPYEVDGYVVVVSFSTRQVIASFNRFREDPE
jgi:hypothetical protein